MWASGGAASGSGATRPGWALRSPKRPCSPSPAGRARAVEGADVRWAEGERVGRWGQVGVGEGVGVGVGGGVGVGAWGWAWRWVEAGAQDQDQGGEVPHGGPTWRGVGDQSLPPGHRRAGPCGCRPSRARRRRGWRRKCGGRRPRGTGRGRWVGRTRRRGRRRPRPLRARARRGPGCPAGDGAGRVEGAGVGLPGADRDEIVGPAEAPRDGRGRWGPARDARPGELPGEVLGGAGAEAADAIGDAYGQRDRGQRVGVGPARDLVAVGLGRGGAGGAGVDAEVGEGPEGCPRTVAEPGRV